MFENFITYTTLQDLEPRLLEWQPTTATLTKQITKAVDYVSLDLSKKFDTRRVMIPLYLATDKQTITSSTTGSWIETQSQNRVKRFVVNKVTCSDGGGSNVWTLEGSNDQVTYFTVATLNNSTGAGKISVTFTDEYKYYRFKMTVGTTLSFTGYIYLVETAFDKLIEYQSLVVIFRSLSKQIDDMPDQKKKIYENDYRNELENLNFSYDYDESGTIEDDEKANTTILSGRFSL